MKSNRFNPSITLADQVFKEIYIATEKEIAGLEKNSKKLIVKVTENRLK
ncbi:hypothetical protein ACIQXQ_20265 [Peribacillus sp. NPDC097198]